MIAVDARSHPAAFRSARSVATQWISLVLSGIWRCATTTGVSWVTAAMNWGIDPSARRPPRAHLPSIATAVSPVAIARPCASASAAAWSSTSGRSRARVHATHARVNASGSIRVRIVRIVGSDGGQTRPSNGSGHAPNASSCARVRAGSPAHCAAAASDSNPGRVNALNTTASTYPSR